MSHRREDAELIWAYEGKEQPWDRFQWLHEEPVIPWLESAYLPVDVPCPSPPSYTSLALLLGQFVLSTYSDLPLCLSSFPLPVLSPVPSLSSLAVPGQHSTDLIWAYSRVKEICRQVDGPAVRELLHLLGKLWGVDLQGALHCFGNYRWGKDPGDIVNLRDVTFKQFNRRLRNFCSVKRQKSRESAWEGQAQEMRIRLETAERRTREMREELEEKEKTIADLRKRLGNQEKQTSDSRPSGSPCLESLPKVPNTLPKCPAFTKRRPGLAVNSLFFEKLQCERAVPLAVDLTCSELGLLRPTQGHAKRISLRKAGNTLHNKANPNHSSGRPGERLVFPCIRRTL